MSDLSGSGELDDGDRDAQILDDIDSSVEEEDVEEDVDDDQLNIKPPQRHADLTKHKHTERSRERKHKRHGREKESRHSRREHRGDRDSRRHRGGGHEEDAGGVGGGSRHHGKSDSPRQRYRSMREYSGRRSRYDPGLVGGGGSGGHVAGSDLRQRLQQQQQQQEAAMRHHRHHRDLVKSRTIPLIPDVGEGGGRRREDPMAADIQRRRDRCLQAVRQSEYQKDVSRKELEARRQRRDRERLRRYPPRDEYVHHRPSRERSLSSERKRRRVEMEQRQAYFYNEEIEEEEEEDVEEHEDSGEDNVATEEEAVESDHQNGHAGSSEKSSEQSASSDESEQSVAGSSESSSSSEEEGEEEEEEDDDNNQDQKVESGSIADEDNASGTEAVEDPRRVEGRRRWRTDSRSPDAERSPGRDDPSRSPTPIQSSGNLHEKQTEKSRSPSPPSSPELKPRLPPYLPAVLGCRNVVEFNCLNRIEEGTYGVVYRAEDKRTKEIVALKRLKMENEKEGFPITSLREINTLLKAQHENIVTVREIVVGSNMDKIYIVMDYVEHDLKSLMQTMKEKKQTFVSGEIKCLMVQMLRAVRHLHDNWILHRDLKTSNLLLSHRGILKVGDFGLAREYGSPLKNYTAVVVTLWYRAPELLLGSRMYACPIDVWSVGCIFGELLRMEPLFPGKSEADQINRIFKELGTPTDNIWPGYSQLPAVKKMNFAEYPYNQLANRFGASLTEKGLSLLNKLLTYDPQRRVTADEALGHSYFEEHPRPIDPSMFPTWPAKSEVSHRKSASSPKPPSGRKNIGDEDLRFQVTAGGAGGGMRGAVEYEMDKAMRLVPVHGNLNDLTKLQKIHSMLMYALYLEAVLKVHLQQQPDSSETNGAESGESRKEWLHNCDIISRHVRHIGATLRHGRCSHRQSHVITENFVRMMESAERLTQTATVSKRHLPGNYTL